MTKTCSEAEKRLKFCYNQQIGQFDPGNQRGALQGKMG